MIMKKLGKVVMALLIAVSVIMPMKMVSVQACENFDWYRNNNDCWYNQQNNTQPCETWACETWACETWPCETQTCETKPRETKPCETKEIETVTETKNNEKESTEKVKETTKEAVTTKGNKETEKNQTPQTGQELPVLLLGMTAVAIGLFVVTKKAKKTNE